MKRLALALLISVAMAAGYSSAQNTPAAKADIGAGKALVAQQCKGCHGMDGRGIAPGIPNLAGQRDRYLVAALREYKQGQRIHAAVRVMAETLNDSGERSVAAYYSSLPPAPAKRVEIFSPYDHGRDLAQACMQCHGRDGNSVVPGTPSLSGQQPDYLVASIQEYLAGAREKAPMHSLIRDLKGRDMESLALYFASQPRAQHGSWPRGDAALGGQLTAVCAGCHGARGVSTDSATPSLASQDPEYLVNALKAYRAGRKHGAMQRAVGALIKSDNDAENIAAFYAAQPGAAALRGRTLIQDIADKCNRCHIGSLNNPAMTVPNINGQDEDYLIMALRSYREDRRESSAMHKMTMPYRDSVIEGIASYYASRSPK